MTKRFNGDKRMNWLEQRTTTYIEFHEAVFEIHVVTNEHSGATRCGTKLEMNFTDREDAERWLEEHRKIANTLGFNDTNIRKYIKKHEYFVTDKRMDI